MTVAYTFTGHEGSVILSRQERNSANVSSVITAGCPIFRSVLHGRALIYRISTLEENISNYTWASANTFFLSNFTAKCTLSCNLHSVGTFSITTRRLRTGYAKTHITSIKTKHRNPLNNESTLTLTLPKIRPELT